MGYLLVFTMFCGIPMLISYPANRSKVMILGMIVVAIWGLFKDTGYSCPAGLIGGIVAGFAYRLAGERYKV
jgi:hypothetical protein